MIGLALSGGGSRAMAFHLGCLRALQDRGILEKTGVISSVSGGSVLAAMYAYSEDEFDAFSARVTSLLSRGLQWSIARNLMSPSLLARVIASNLISSPTAFAARAFGAQPPMQRWASRTDALESTIAEIIGDVSLSQVKRHNLDIVFNATELRTGTAFRFSNRCSGGWRTGEIKGNHIGVATAVACSAAYPLLLPAIDRRYIFVKHGLERLDRVVLTDGGVYDNLGIACLEPGRDPLFSLHNYRVDYLICCNAGYGQFSGGSIPFGFYTRTKAAYQSTFRKVQDAAFDRLHSCQRIGSLKGFILPYLGQQDASLPIKPADLVTRAEVMDYPTNFAAMDEGSLNKIATRGEQLTRILLRTYCPDL